MYIYIYIYKNKYKVTNYEHHDGLLCFFHVFFLTQPLWTNCWQIDLPLKLLQDQVRSFAGIPVIPYNLSHRDPWDDCILPTFCWFWLVKVGEYIIYMYMKWLFCLPSWSDVPFGKIRPDPSAYTATIFAGFSMWSLSLTHGTPPWTWGCMCKRYVSRLHGPFLPVFWESPWDFNTDNNSRHLRVTSLIGILL